MKMKNIPRAEFCNANTRIAEATQIQSSGTLSTGKPASKKNGRRNFLSEPFAGLQKASAYVSTLPGGNGNSDGSFNNVGNNGNWWSATENNANNAYNRNMNYNNSNVNRNNNNKSNLFSVRCLQDCNGEAGKPVSPIFCKGAACNALTGETIFFCEDGDIKMLELKNIHKSFGNVRVLDGVSFRLENKTWIFEVFTYGKRRNF